MKKIIIFALIFMLNLSLVNADILPDYPKDTHEVEIKNIIENIDDYPDYIFFKTYYSIYGISYDTLLNGGFFGGGRIRFIKNNPNTKLELENLFKQLNESHYPIYKNGGCSSDCENSILNFGAINFIDVVSKRRGKDGVDPKEEINYLTINPEMFYLPKEFRLNNNLSDKAKENLKNLVKTSYEKFEINLKQLSDDKQENIINSLVSKIDNLLEEEKRESVIFALLYLKYLSINE